MNQSISSILGDLHLELLHRRDSEISLAQEVLVQYIQDHRDREAYREVDRQVSSLAKAWDKMISSLERKSFDPLGEVMGTNYYYHSSLCPTCGKGDSPLHIGKASAGWCFLLRIYPEREINSLEDWNKLFFSSGGSIRSEYGEDIPPGKMLEIITLRSWSLPLNPPRDDYGLPGPNNLMRLRIATPGPGTWDLMEGDFS